MVNRFQTGEPLEELTGICSTEELVRLQEQCRKIFVKEELMQYMIRVIHATRKHQKVAHGVSPRGTIAFVRAAQGYAFVSGRDYVVPEDIKTVAVPALAHRLSLSVSSEGSQSAKKIIQEILESVALPTEEW